MPTPIDIYGTAILDQPRPPGPSVGFTPAPPYQPAYIPTGTGSDVYRPGVDYTPANPSVPGSDVYEPSDARRIRWYFESIRSRLVADRPVADPSGPNVLTHWMDNPAAIGWIDEANRRVGALTNQDNMAGVLEAIANVYNASNLVWYLDPEARRLWRKYFAGEPLGDEFGVGSNSQNYNRNWYQANLNYPTTELPNAAGLRVGNPNFGGLITAAARNEFIAAYPNPAQAVTHPSEFRQMAGVYVDVQAPQGGEGLADLRSAERRINSFFLYREITRDPLPIGVFMPSRPAGLDGNHIAFIDALQCSPAASDVRSCETAGWDTLRFVAAAGALGGEWNPYVPLPLWARLHTYVAWLQEWVATLVARQPFQIVLDTRRFSIVQTMGMINSSGGTIASALAEVASTRSRVWDQAHANNTTLQVAAAVAGALGAATGIVTGGVGTVIGAAVATGLLIADAANIEAIHDIGRDDLGRYKPVLENAWLDGNPFDDGRDPTRPGMPSPGLEVPLPPGFVRQPRWEYPPPGTVEIYTNSRRDLARRLNLPHGVDDLPSVAALSFEHASQFLAMPDPQMFEAFKREYCQLPPGGLRTQADADIWSYQHPWCPRQLAGAGTLFGGSNGKLLIGGAVLVGGLGLLWWWSKR